MTIDDPFDTSDGDSGERTIIRPVPGGRRPGQGEPTPPRPAPAPPEETVVPSGVGLNPLEAAAAPLLSLIMRLKDRKSVV